MGSWDAVLFERRVLSWVVGLGVLGVALWVAAISTPYWKIQVYPKYHSAIWGHAGLLTTCVLNYDTEGENRNHNITKFRGLQADIAVEKYKAAPENSTDDEDLEKITKDANKDLKKLTKNATKNQEKFNHEDENQEDLEKDEYLKKRPVYWKCSRTLSNSDTYSSLLARSEFALCFVGLFLGICSIGFSIYSLYHPKYVYKRLVAVLYILTSGCTLTVLQLLSAVTETNTQDMYGVSYLLGWTSCIAAGACGLAFLVYSRKRKLLESENIEFSHQRLTFQMNGK
ncbi:uncharacterized protein LOC111708835 [Eurytemora carolleeae]|uniref:uncharacterized protein LOC111708835 n=1 Tax=Eurytemora carolleeae TaxID=1294199 RepID=UPI000C786A25|nr:uncharacterized protein LOC111708835 [Eurytemora carolleeae]|eukprot:XP_023338103.1 uncharacterized protein LOC111708835 [Eurytemora affinis]